MNRRRIIKKVNNDIKVIGLCFLIYDIINHERLWYHWLKNANSKKYKIYIHYKTNVELKYFEKYKLNNCIDTKYAHVTMIHAHNLLFKKAYQDGCFKIISLSQACIPFKTFDHVYKFLTEDNFSHFNIVPEQIGVFPRCNNVISYYNKNNIQKTSNWFILNRNIAKIICFNSVEKINSIWDNIVFPEEHYFITEVFRNNLTSEIKATPNLASGATTFTNWSGMDYPYNTRDQLKNYSSIDEEEIDYLIKEPCLFGRKFNPECQVLENNELINKKGLTEYLIKKIC